MRGNREQLEKIGLGIRVSKIQYYFPNSTVGKSDLRKGQQDICRCVHHKMQTALLPLARTVDE